MEPYKKIEEFDDHFYFTGNVTLKYGADFKKDNSVNFGNNHFEHRIYYDLYIDEISEINEDQFNSWNPAFQVTNIKDQEINARFGNENYLIKSDRIFLHRDVKSDHAQVEGVELHGEFREVPVIFRMARPSKKIKCIPNYLTGNTQIIDGVLHKEITTGNLLSDGDTCETIWIPEHTTPPQPCPKDIATGKKENKGNCVRFEFYSGNLNSDGIGCETYWGEWTCNCVQDQWTNRTKIFEGWIWREYYNSDCSTYWKQYEKVPTPPPDGIKEGCSKGCLPIILTTLAIIWAAYCIWLTIRHNTYLPILFGIGIPLLLALVGSGINFLGRYSGTFSRIFGWLMNLIVLIVILAILNGLFNFFSSVDWSNSDSGADDEFDQQEVVDVDPNNTDDSNHIPETSEERKKYARIHLKWKDLGGRKYEGTFAIKVEDTRKSAYKLRSLKNRNYNSYGPIYNEVYLEDRNYLNDLYTMLDSIRIKKEQNNAQFAQAIVTMVQSIDYVLILEQSCEDASLVNNENIQEMLSNNVPCDGNAPFGIKTPTEFLTTLKGDCDTRTLLLYTIFKHYKYNVAIINSDFYGHSMLGLQLKNVQGAYKSVQGKRYYFWETTGKGFNIGQLPRGMGNLNYWKIEIN